MVIIVKPQQLDSEEASSCILIFLIYIYLFIKLNVLIFIMRISCKTFLRFAFFHPETAAASRDLIG